MIQRLRRKKANIEKMLETLPPKEAFWKVFVTGNFVLGVTSGIFIRFFWLVVKYTDFKYLTLFYCVRFFMYTWLVFYAGFSTIYMLKRHQELPRWVLTTIYGYIALSILCLYWFETFMPFQAVGSELFHFIYNCFWRKHYCPL